LDIIKDKKSPGMNRDYLYKAEVSLI